MSKGKRPFLPVDPTKAAMYGILAELPERYYTGIGRVIQAHAILENRVSETMFDIMKIGYAEGRVAFKYRAASTQFDLVVDLVHLRGLKPSIDLNALRDQIKDCCEARDQLGHCVWVRDSDIIGIRLTDGHYETPEGKRSRAVLPEGKVLADDYFEAQRQLTMETVEIVQALKNELKTLLQP